MPALNQNPLLTLDALASCGAVLPTEVQAALDTSLSLKGRELGVQQFLFWGRLSTLNGKDYYIACAFNGTKLVDGKVILNPGNKFYYSQDGVNWLDLEPVSGEQAEKAAKLECASPPPSTPTRPVERRDRALFTHLERRDALRSSRRARILHAADARRSPLRRNWRKEFSRGARKGKRGQERRGGGHRV